MKIQSLFEKVLLLVLCAGSLFSGVPAQKPGSTVPRQEKLLNGLKLLMWTDPAAADVKVSIRVHSGSAFDPQGKEGVMQLLADNIFPSADSKAFFSEDLGGSVEVVTNYDYIQINATAKPSSFVDLLQTLAQTVSNPTIDRDTTAALKKALAEKLRLLEKDPAYVADQAAAKRLFGTFPYGRPQMGSVESLQRIDFADLQFAKERFLSADNATVAIGGNFNGDLGFRAARRYFGAWLKSDKRVPSTFRQPDEPDTKVLEMTLEGAPARTTFALRGFARNDPDYAASLVLENVLKSRLQRNGAAVALSQSSRALPGVLVVSVPGSAGFPFKSFSEKISESEFARARSEAAAEISRKTLFDQWLDVDTYHTTVTSDAGAFQKVSVADVQRVADRLARNPVVSVLLKSPAAAQ
ncbi:MAG: insulinase family protein [Pyrinomonadaceae bacterium]